jgi:hypothetical protein
VLVRHPPECIGLMMVAGSYVHPNFPLTPLTSRRLTQVVIQNILEARSQDALPRYSIHPIAPPVVHVMVRSRFPRLECPHCGYS